MNRKRLISIAVLLVSCLATVSRAPAQTGTANNEEAVQMLVTVEPRKNAGEVPVIHREDVMVYDEKERVHASDWRPYDQESQLELFLLIDDSLDPGVIGNQLQDLRSFISTRSPQAAIGVAYMRNGTVQIAEKPTTDHGAAAKAVRLPSGGTATAEPYDALKALIQQWPRSQSRREVVMISNGIEGFGTPDPANSLVTSAIEAAQRADIPVFTIYANATGHLGHSLWRTNLAQSYLSRLADESGGEMYNLINQNVSFTTYLDDIGKRLKRQYLLSFVPQADKRGLHRVRLTTEVPNVDLVAADAVWVGP